MIKTKAMAVVFALSAGVANAAPVSNTSDTAHSARCRKGELTRTR